MQAGTQSIHYRFDFLKYRKIAYCASIVFTLLGVGLYFTRGLVYHIDFAGGAELRLSFEQPIDIAAVRSALSKEARIQEVGVDKKNFLIQVSSTEHGVEQEVLTQLQVGVPNNKAHVDSVEMIGAEVGKDTKWNALKAIILALIGLLLYIAVRSEFRFGVGATVGLMHDIVAALIFLAIAREPVSLHILASVLAVLGYSLNDTIVIFSRIRENMKKMQGASEYDIVNLSINQTLRRTILTSFATFLSVLAILFLGGEALRGLSAVLLIGIAVGTYSSIYVASAIMLDVGGKKK